MSGRKTRHDAPVRHIARCRPYTRLPIVWPILASQYATLDPYTLSLLSFPVGLSCYFSPSLRYKGPGLDVPVLSTPPPPKPRERSRTTR